MRAPIAPILESTEYAEEAAKIVRSCVHCGFCNATCPTYQLTGDELEGPRGRIYLIKALLEDGTASAATQTHLDQCLLCRNCETTCPSGVQYGRLAEIMRPEVNALTPWPWYQRLQRWLIATVVPYPRRLAPLVAMGRFVRPLLPRVLARKIPPRQTLPPAPVVAGDRRVLLLGGCAQPVLSPAIDAAARAVFARVGIELLALNTGCCGALPAHLGYAERAAEFARRNLDAWWPHIEAGAEAVIATSSGCGVQLKDYATLLRNDPAYAERARRVQDLVRDPVEILDPAALAPLLRDEARESIAFQAPCTLQHGQRLAGRVEGLLTELGWTLAAVAEPHLCCGSAGSYSLLHPATSTALAQRKLDHLLAGAPARIVTANVGCQLHLGAHAAVPVSHWLEVLAAALRPT